MCCKKTEISVYLFLSILFMYSCAPAKDIAYFQKVDTKAAKSTKNQPIIPPASLYEARIKPKDLLSITVVSTQPEASVIYNLVVPQIDNSASQNSLLSQPILQTYLVDNDGNIEFPVFGKIKVGGLTRNEVETVLHTRLESAFSKEAPIITIRFVNYSVNILGEVQRPGKFETNNDRLTIFEGLALAGDLTIYGRRDNVKVLREKADGTKEYITMNLSDKNIIYSPAYYLEQNDVVYVEPNKSRGRSSNYGAAETFGISSLSVLLTLTSLVFTIFKFKI